MTEKTISTRYRECAISELNEEDRRLVEACKKATGGSYAPYSHFNVGAALLLENGEIVLGANQENAAFGAGTCGERSALYNAGANYPNVPIVKLAVTAYTAGDFVADPCSPCGICRQAMVEFETKSGKPMQVLLVAKDRVYILDSAKDLLPLGFTEF